MTTTTHASFVIERSYSASPQRIFAAWANPAAKRAWFVEGDGWDIQSYEIDFREGGKESSKYLFRKGEEIFGEKTVFTNDTVFNEIIPNERIVFTYAMDRNGKRFSVSLATVEIKLAGKGSRLIFSEHGAFFDGADGVQMREQGWQDLLKRLDEHLAEIKQ